MYYVLQLGSSVHFSVNTSILWYSLDDPGLAPQFHLTEIPGPIGLA